MELSGVASMLSWVENRVSPKELWKLWLTSSVVRAFETGRSTPEVFADELIAEMVLPVRRDEFLQEFVRRTLGLFPGALDLVNRIPRQYARATLCNNASHFEFVRRAGAQVGRNVAPARS